MQLTLNDEEVRLLRDILHDHLPNLRREAAGTELSARELRHELAMREALCERILTAIDDETATPSTESK